MRGAAGFFPFAPGGLEGVEAAAALEEQAMKASGTTVSSASKLERVINFSSEGGLLEVAPGFSRGLDFSLKKVKVDQREAEDIESVLDQEPDDGDSARDWGE